MRKYNKIYKGYLKQEIAFYVKAIIYLILFSAC